MKKTLYRAVALVALAGLCGAANAELVCDDGAVGSAPAARAGCVAEKPTRANTASRSGLARPVRPGSSPPAPPLGGAVKGKPFSFPPNVPVAPVALTHWEILASDLSIYGAIKRWSDANGWQVSWELSNDYPVTVLDSFDDNYRGAVDAVLDAYRSADVAPKGCFYENKVLRVVRRVGDDLECKQK